MFEKLDQTIVKFLPFMVYRISMIIAIIMNAFTYYEIYVSNICTYYAVNKCTFVEIWSMMCLRCIKIMNRIKFKCTDSNSSFTAQYLCSVG